MIEISPSSFKAVGFLSFTTGLKTSAFIIAGAAKTIGDSPNIIKIERICLNKFFIYPPSIFSHLFEYRLSLQTFC